MNTSRCCTKETIKRTVIFIIFCGLIVGIAVGVLVNSKKVQGEFLFSPLALSPLQSWKFSLKKRNFGFRLNFVISHENILWYWINYLHLIPVYLIQMSNISDKDLRKAFISSSLLCLLPISWYHQWFRFDNTITF